jgi:hypothetical protein
MLALLTSVEKFNTPCEIVESLQYSGVRVLT